MDSLQKIFRHQDYELTCTARAIEGGRYAPTLTVSKQAWPSRPREIAVEKVFFATQDAAIDAAYAQGLAWIQHYG